MNINFFLIQLLRQYRSNIITLILLLPIAFSASSAPVLPEEMHSLAISTIDKIYKENLTQAEDEARKIIRKYPNHPVGYFFTAVILDSWMYLCQSKQKENEFYHYCDLTVEKSEKILMKSPDDEWAKFFIGGAEGYKGSYEGRFEKWITAFRYGWKGVSVLLELEKANSSLTDIDFGIGNYYYWRSALMKLLWWMPGIEDKREEGIERLYRAKKDGVYTSVSAAVSLISILINEKRYSDAFAVSEEMLKKYPKSCFFLWGHAEILAGLKRHKESNDTYLYLLQKVKTYSVNNLYNEAVIHLGLAKNYAATNQLENAVKECCTIETLHYSRDVKKRLEKILQESKLLKKKCQMLLSDFAKRKK